MKKILVLDNYDSFTYNLVHYLESLNCETVVFRNDKITLEEVDLYDTIVLSPGPGIPEEAGILLPLIKKYGPSKKILGVCLGHQAIGQVYGAELYNIGKVVHGKAKNTIILENDVIFDGLPKEFETGRYHSWAIKNIPASLSVTSNDDEGIVMSIKHKTHNVRGVQFHPESVMTPDGMKIIKNWVEKC
jgi:anthranilate synthase component 2